MDEPTQLEDIFLRKKPARLLVYIKNEKYPYASTLAKKIDCTYAHTIKLLTKFQEFGLVTFEKEGRVKFIALTDRGRDIADELDILIFRRISSAVKALKQGEKPVEKEKKPTEEEEEKREAEEQKPNKKAKKVPTKAEKVEEKEIEKEVEEAKEDIGVELDEETAEDLGA